jgi:hypothetical protein
MRGTAFFLVLVLIICCRNTSAQEVQIWVDGFFYRDIGKLIQLESNPGWNKLVETEGWADYHFNNTLTWSALSWYELEGSLELHYTRDPSGTDIDEIDIWVGQRFIFTSFIDFLHIRKPYFYLRLEQRFLKYIDDGTKDQKVRMVPRVGSKFILGNTKLSPGTFFIPWYIEGFINLNGEAKEKYALKNKTAVGLGYVINEKWRGEFYHYLQRSRNSIEDSFAKTDLIFQARLKYYFD